MSKRYHEKGMEGCMSQRMKNIVEYLATAAKIFSVFAGAFFLPKFFIYVAHEQTQLKVKTVIPPFKFGLENLSEASLKNFSLPGGKKHVVALITNQTGKDQQGNRNIDILLSKGVNLRYIFTPKHGFNANEGAPKYTQKVEDLSTKIPIISWRESMLEGSLCNNSLKKVDLLVFDMQDSGIRFGYVTTLLEVMEAAAKYSKKIIVLDRPNLLGNSMEGTVAALTVVKNSSESAIPIRYGMTVGELAHYFNKHVLANPACLHVVPMENYQRNSIQNKSLLLSGLSPNLPTIDSCHGYSFLGLLGEIAPFDVGLGTDNVFQCLALPDAYNISRNKWYEVRTLLKDFGVESKLYRYYSPRKKYYCSGLKLCIKDINNFSSFAALLSVVKFFKKEGVKLTLSRQFDAILGTEKVRKFLDGSIQHSDLEMEVSAGLRNFFHKAASSCIYSPLPRVIGI